jgi:hypothetical protein
MSSANDGQNKPAERIPPPGTSTRSCCRAGHLIESERRFAQEPLASQAPDGLLQEPSPIRRARLRRYVREEASPKICGSCFERCHAAPQAQAQTPVNGAKRLARSKNFIACPRSDMRARHICRRAVQGNLYASSSPFMLTTRSVSLASLAHRRYCKQREAGENEINARKRADRPKRGARQS